MDCRERILSEDYYDIITDFPLREELLEDDLCYIAVENLYNLIYLNKEGAEPENDYLYTHRILPKLYGLMQEGNLGLPEAGFDPNNLIVSGITQIQREPLNLTGRGCVLVVIDTGIDYTSPVFLNSDGSSRILAIWDQTIQTGNPPDGLFYGTEYIREEINRALAAPNPYEIVESRDEIGHGTSMAAVAAGSRLENGLTYLGAAPEADIVVVKLKPCKRYLRDFYLLPEEVPAYEETDIMLGVLYGNRFADTFRRPVVFCLGIGTSYGDHAGSSALSRYLDSIAVRRSRAVVAAGGNEGNADHHFQGHLSRNFAAGNGAAGNTGNGNSSQTVEIRVGENAKGFLLHLWGTVPDIFSVSVRSPGGETIPAIRLGIQDVITYSFIYERTKITIAGELVEPGSGEELIKMRIVNPTPGIWSFEVVASGEIHNGNFHMWLPITEFLNTEVYFLTPSPYITLTEPALASSVISVSTYNGNNNSFYINSGRGFSRTGAVRPDFSAPGVNISTPRGSQTGSSLAAAITAGAVAQFMQWAIVEQNNVVVESREIKNYFARGASRSFDATYPNREWGYGRLNMVGTFDALIGV